MRFDKVLGMDLSEIPSSFPVPVEGVRLLRRKDLLVAGFTVDTIRAALRRGDRDRIAPGRFRDPPGAELQSDDLLRLQVLAVTDRNRTGVVSHRSAAILHGLPVLAAPNKIVHVTRPQHGGGRGNHWVRVHAGHLDEVDVVHGFDLRLTSLARTLIDLARTAPFETAVVAIDFALHHGLVLPSEVVDAAGRAFRSRGMVRARRALRFADGRSESVGESRCRVALHREGLPPPELQVVVRDQDGRFRGRSDFGWPKDRALLEFDGKVKYSGTAAGVTVVSEKLREDEIRATQVAMGRAVWSDLPPSPGLRTTVGRVLVAGRQFLGAPGAGSLVPLPPLRIDL